MVKFLIQAEGLAVFFLSVYSYFLLRGNWILFILTILVPDVSMTGYLFNNKIGAWLYDSAHTYLFPIFLLIVGNIFQIKSLILFAMIVFAHIGMDRALGYGIKYVSHFKDTHIQKL